ncbi:hypothetical protein Tco_0565120 [Tanacetum coccineum]
MGLKTQTTNQRTLDGNMKTKRTLAGANLNQRTLAGRCDDNDDGYDGGVYKGDGGVGASMVVEWRGGGSRIAPDYEDSRARGTTKMIHGGVKTEVRRPQKDIISIVEAFREASHPQVVLQSLKEIDLAQTEAVLSELRKVQVNKARVTPSNIQYSAATRILGVLQYSDLRDLLLLPWPDLELHFSGDEFLRVKIKDILGFRIKGFISDLEEDPEEDFEEDHADYLVDGGDDDDEPYDDDDDDDDDTDDEDKEPFEDEEEEEHLAPADSPAAPDVSYRPQTPVPFPYEAKVERLLALPIPPPSPLTPLSSLLPQIPSPPLPPPPSSLHLPPLVHTSLPLPLSPLPPLPASLFIPPVDCREDTSEAELPPRKRLCLIALTSRYENNMPPKRTSATARAAAAAAATAPITATAV